MVNTGAPYRAKDIDFQLSGGGEVYRGASIEITKTVSREDEGQLGTQTTDYFDGGIMFEWSLTVQEVTGNFATLEAWCDGSSTHTLNISKGAATLALSNAKCFTMTNPHSVGSTSEITITGTATAVNEA